MQCLLERRGLLLLSHAARAVDGADLAAGVAVTTTVGHTLCSSIRVGVNEGVRAARNGRHDGEVGCWCHSVLID